MLPAGGSSKVAKQMVHGGVGDGGAELELGGPGWGARFGAANEPMSVAKMEGQRPRLPHYFEPYVASVGLRTGTKIGSGKDADPPTGSPSVHPTQLIPSALAPRDHSLGMKSRLARR